MEMADNDIKVKRFSIAELEKLLQHISKGKMKAKAAEFKGGNLVAWEILMDEPMIGQANADLFSNAADFARELLAIKQRERWIPILKQSDYGGPESVFVLLVVDGKVHFGFRTTSYEWCNTHGMVQSWKPTHWRPLPAPPSSETKEK